jgi:hypothetical protein
MKLLFNKPGADFSKEFKDALGFVDADFKFQKIKPDLVNATQEIASFLGNTTYLEIVATYESNFDYETTAGQILQFAQNAIANLAYRYFAPSNDLQHGTNGRKMLTSEDSKTPFEYMIVASNDELERRSHRAMDNLINLLDESSNTWKASDNYKATHRLFVRTVKEFNQFYTINSRYLLEKLSPGIAMAEKRLIIPRIGQTAYDALKAKRKDGSALSADEEPLLLMIQEATVYAALAWGVIRLQVTLFPDSISQAVRGDRATIKGRMPIVNNVLDQLEQKFKEDTAQVLLDIEAAVKEPDPEPTTQTTNCPDEDKFGFRTDDGFVG